MSTYSRSSWGLAAACQTVNADWTMVVAKLAGTTGGPTRTRAARDGRTVGCGARGGRGRGQVG
ncbi:hypothetical protein, partial [Streptomyces sp. NPDC002922]|uniref:hypothetical protein n=1 Tax=Streptomyces sp. NPDC002922 TaxID=3154439 RepID=UPI0033BD89C6